MASLLETSWFDVCWVPFKKVAHAECQAHLAIRMRLFSALAVLSALISCRSNQPDEKESLAVAAVAACGT